MQLDLLDLEIGTESPAKVFNDRNLKKRFIELFAGIGLVRKGLERTGWACVYANDIDPDKKSIYQMNFKDDHFHLGDIWKVTPDQIPQPFELITASFPCTDLSLAGNRAGLKGEQSGTFWAFIQLLEGFKKRRTQPKFVLVENVLGFMTSHGGADFVAAIKALNDLGYRADAFVVDARHFTPQSRPRLFIVAFLDSINSTLVTLPQDDENAFQRILTDKKNSIWRPTKLSNVILSNPQLKWGLFELPTIKAHTVRLHDVIEVMPEDDPRWWSIERNQKTLSQLSPLHRKQLDALIANDSYTYGTIYRRTRATGNMSELRLDGFAGCLRTPRGGSSRQIVARIGKGTFAVRWMTPREYARLQGVDDTFVLSENETKSLFGFGDAVCVPAIEWIAKNVIDPLVYESSSEINKS